MDALTTEDTDELGLLFACGEGAGCSFVVPTRGVVGLDVTEGIIGGEDGGG